MIKNLKQIFLFMLLCAAGLKACDHPAGDEYYFKQRSISRLIVRLCSNLPDDQLKTIVSYLQDSRANEQKTIEEFTHIDQMIACQKPDLHADDYFKSVFEEFRTRLQEKDPIILDWFLSHIEFYKNHEHFDLQ